jgi:hypothetical protein
VSGDRAPDRQTAAQQVRHTLPAVATLEWVHSVEVCVTDQVADPEPDVVARVTAAWSDDRDGDEPWWELRRRAFCARQHALLTGLLERGIDRVDLCRVRVGDLRRGPGTAVYLQRRREVGLPVGDDAPLAVSEDGGTLDATDVDDHLGLLRRCAVPRGGRVP